MKSTYLSLLIAVSLCACNRTTTPPPPEKPAELHPAGITTNTPPVADNTDALLQQALTLKTTGKLAEARDLLRPLADAPNAPDKLLTLLGDLNIQIALTGAAAPEKANHTIETGDGLGKLAKKYGTTMELIKKSNGLTGDMIRLGDRLRIYQGKFTVEVSKTANTLTLTDNNHFFKRYRVGTGQQGRTPTGTYKITTRLEKPAWYRADGSTIPYGNPDNILGTHWLGLDIPRYGIHGTWETNSIGKQSSAGCIRLLNDDIAELYLLLPTGTPVNIHD